jgi:hypothetical protein
MIPRRLVSAIALVVAAGCATEPTMQLDWKCNDLVCFSERVAGPDRTVVVENRGEVAVTVRPRAGWEHEWSRCCQVVEPPSEVLVAPHEQRELMKFQLINIRKHTKRAAVVLLQGPPPFDVAVGDQRRAPPPAPEPETPADP